MTTPMLRRSAIVLASMLTLAGCAAATAADARPVPKSAVSRLTEIAKHAARANGDRHLLWATAVLTTHEQALRSATPGDTVSNRRHVAAYLVTIRGRFVCKTCSVPPGANAPKGRYISIVVDAKTFKDMDFGLSQKASKLSPSSLGPVTHLIGHGS